MQPDSVPDLKQLVLDLELRQGGDSGVPLMVSAPNSATGLVFQTIAQEVSDRVKNAGVSHGDD